MPSGICRGVFADGARDMALPFDAAGHAHVAGPLRHPLLLLGSLTALGAESLTVTVVIHLASDPATAIATSLSFAPYTEAGAFLPIYASDAGKAGSAVHGDFDVELTLTDPAPDAVASELVELHLVQGLFGRTIYLLGAEKQRIRRQAREIAAARRVSSASANALDQIGAEVGVPRLQDRLDWDAVQSEPVSIVEREADASYRNRLAIYRPFVAACPSRVLSLLNGDDDRPGLLAPLGLGVAVGASEANSELALAVRLVGSGASAEQQRTDFLKSVRTTYLVQPGAPVPESALLPGLARSALIEMLARLSKAFDFPAGAFLAPQLGYSLDLLGRIRVALGIAVKWPVTRAQDDTGGSRYELGLGVEVAMPAAADLDLMSANLAARTFTGTLDFRLQVLVDSLLPQPSAADPQGRWLLSACGLRTIHSTAAGLYLSHLPFHAMQLNTTAGPALSMAARLSAPGDADQDARLSHALTSILADSATAGITGLTVLSAADAQTAFTQVQAIAVPAFDRTGLRMPAESDDLARAISALANVPPEAMLTLQLDVATSAGILADGDAEVAQLAKLVDLLRQNEIVSVLPLVTTNSLVMLVIAVIDLPGAAVILNGRVSAFHWYVVPVQGPRGGLVAARGPRNRYLVPAEDGLAAVIALTLVRRDREDPRGCIAPYEIRLDMADADRLNLPQFEFLMNLMRRIVPLGIVVDTGSLRESHVDPDGEGHMGAFTGRHSHSFRAFQQTRYVGFVNTES